MDILSFLNSNRVLAASAAALLCLICILVFRSIGLSNPFEDDPEAAEPQEIEAELFTRIPGMFSSDLNKAFAINGWIAQTYPIMGTGDPVHDAMIRQCGYRDIIFNKMARAHRMDVRRINFFGVPIVANHTATEIRAGKNWHFFDSTYGIYFTALEDDKPLSITDARRMYPNIRVWAPSKDFAVAEIRDRLTISYAPTDLSWLPFPNTEIPMVDIQRTYFTSDMHGAPEHQAFRSSLFIDLERDPNGQLGNVDEDSLDLGGTYFDVSGVQQFAQLHNRLGEFKTMRSKNVLQFAARQPTEVTVRVERVREGEGPILPDIDHTAVHYSMEETKIQVTDQGKQQEFTFMVYPPLSEFSIQAPQGTTIYLDSMTWKSD